MVTFLVNALDISGLDTEGVLNTVSGTMKGTPSPSPWSVFYGRTPGFSHVQPTRFRLTWEVF